MAGLTTIEQEAVSLFDERVQAAFSGRVEAIQLFGSKSRGEAEKHSDVDVLVVLKKMTWQDKKAIRAIAADIIFTLGAVLSVQIFSSAEFAGMKQRRAIFWQMIEPDLKPV